MMFEMSNSSSDFWFRAQEKDVKLTLGIEKPFNTKVVSELINTT